MAKGRYKAAYESGETDAILEAQTALNTAQIRMEKVNGLKPRKIPTLQPQRNSCTTAGRDAPLRGRSGTRKLENGPTKTRGLGQKHRKARK
jgi:hypothetical protein